MDAVIMNVLDSAKSSADKITHALRKCGGDDMNKGVEKIYNLGDYEYDEESFEYPEYKIIEID